MIKIKTAREESVLLVSSLDANVFELTLTAVKLSSLLYMYMATTRTNTDTNTHTHTHTLMIGLWRTR